MVNPEDTLIEAALRRHARSEESQDHLEADELADYAAGEIDELRSEQIAAHLATCTACTAIVAELTQDEGDAAGEWRGLRERLVAEGALSAGSAGSAPSGGRRHLYALAAILAGLAVGLLFGPVFLDGGGDELRPTSTTQVATVASAVRGIPPRRETVTLNPGAEKVVLLLPTFANRAPSYRVEARNDETGQSWGPWDATPDAHGNVALELQPEAHGTGLYEIELQPIGSEDSSALRFEIRLIPAGTFP